MIYTAVYKLLILILIIITPIIFFTAKVIDEGRQGIVVAEPNVSNTYKAEIFASGLKIPWSLVFTGPDRMLVSERIGRIREIENGKMSQEPLIVFSDVYVRGEAGLMGITKDPDYLENGYVYAAYTYPKGSNFAVKVIRFTDIRQSDKDVKILVNNIPAAQIHTGTRIKFGRDGRLYVSTGDAMIKSLSQAEFSYGGKIFSMERDGSDIRIYAKGFRNTQGFDWDPVNSNLWAVDHGPSGFDGKSGGDEINLVVQGGNYGWPLISHQQSRSGLLMPKLLFSPAIAPAALVFYRGDNYPQLRERMIFSGLRGEGLFSAQLSPDRTEIINWEKLDIHVGRIRDVIEGPDGWLYFSTSNTDGRGKPRERDDKIYRLILH